MRCFLKRAAPDSWYRLSDVGTEKQPVVQCRAALENRHARARSKSTVDRMWVSVSHIIPMIPIVEG